MKGLTLTQPWATLIAIGAKQIETRSWSTTYRGPIAIHAAKNLEPVGGVAGLVQFYWREPFASTLSAAGYTAELDRELPRGVIVAVAELAYCFPTDEVRYDLEVDSLAGVVGSLELAFGNFAPSRFAWRLANVRQLAVPVEIPKGAVRDYRGLWDVPAELELPEPIGAPA